MTILALEIDDNILQIKGIKRLENVTLSDLKDLSLKKKNDFKGKTNASRKALLKTLMLTHTVGSVGKITFGTVDEMRSFLGDVFKESNDLTVRNVVIDRDDQTAGIETDFVNLYAANEDGYTLAKLVHHNGTVLADLHAEKGNFDDVAECIKFLAFDYRSQL